MARTFAILCSLLLAGCPALETDSDSGVMADADAGTQGDAGIAPDAGVDDAGTVDAGRDDEDGGVDDAGSAIDAGPTDAGSNDAGPTDAGSTDAGSPDAGPRDAGAGIGVFVATGLVGRTTASFDDGQSWEANTSDDDSFVCTPTPASVCFEGNRTARGVAYLNGYFFVTFGWSRESGRSNSVRRSANGRNWTPVLTPGGFGGIAAGRGAVVLAGPSGSKYMMRNTNNGTGMWTQEPNGFGDWVNFRHVAFVRALGGRFIFGGDGNGFEANRIVYSLDGTSWQKPTMVPAACPSNFRLFGGFGSVGNRIIMMGGDSQGSACTSDNGGGTWQTMPSIGAKVSSHDLISTANRVYVWSSNKVHWTENGMTWSSQNLTPAGVSIGSVAYSPDTGTFVAVTSGYFNGYANQRFYRSANGINWTELPANKYVKSHHIMGIAYGRIAAP